MGGLALIGVGAVAGLIGLATLLPGGDGSTAAASPTNASVAPVEPVGPTAAPLTAVTTVPTSVGGVPVPSFGATPTNGLAAPGSPGAGPAAGAPVATAGTGTDAGNGTGDGGTGGAGGGGTVVTKAPVRVYNNSTITGLAARAADDFRGNGWTVDAVSNYPSGVIATSTVYYRPGTSEQVAAGNLGKAFGMRVEPRFTGLDEATPGLIVIVTNDYQKR